MGTLPSLPQANLIHRVPWFIDLALSGDLSDSSHFPFFPYAPVLRSSVLVVRAARLCLDITGHPLGELDSYYILQMNRSVSSEAIVSNTSVLGLAF